MVEDHLYRRSGAGFPLDHFFLIYLGIVYSYAHCKEYVSF